MTGIPLIIGTQQHMQHLSLRQLFIQTLHVQLAFKNLLTLFFKFPGQFHIFWYSGTKYQNPGLSRTFRDVWHVWA